MLGRAAIAMWWDVAPQMRAEFEDWHTHEHMPERLSIPGFRRGSRWLAPGVEPSYFILYEVAGLSTITGGPYLERLNNPTPWSRSMMSHHRNMTRSLCRVRASFGAGLAQATATIRFSPAPRRKAAIANWLAAEALPALPQAQGLASAHLLSSQPTPSVPQTIEQTLRGGDARADWVLLLGGYDTQAVEENAGRLVRELDARGGVATAVAIYTLSMSFTPQDLSRKKR